MKFEEFYKSNYLILYNLAISILHDEEESRDIVADTYKKVWQMWEKSDDPLSLAKSILRNACISRIRHIEVQERFKRRTISDIEINNTEDKVHEKRIELLRKYITSLNDEEQQIIRLVIYERKTLKEASELLDCSYATIRRHFTSLIYRLKEYISNCE